MKKLIQAQWEAIYTYLHAVCPGKQCHHVNGRKGCFLGCKLLILAMTREKHEKEHLDHKIRTENMELIRDILNSWNKRKGCTKQHKPECADCPLLESNIIKNEFFKTF